LAQVVFPPAFGRAGPLGMAAGGGSAAPLRGAAGARASADRLVARLQRQLADADRRRLEAEEAIDTLVGDAEVGARVRCLLPALAALVAGRAPTWLQKLRRNVALHAAAPGARILAAEAAELRAAQHGPRLERAAVVSGPFDDVEKVDTVDCGREEALAARGASGILETQGPWAGGGLHPAARVLHVAELEPRLLAQADALAAERAPLPGLGGQGGTDHQDLLDAQGQLHGATPEGLVPGGLGTFPICSVLEASAAGPMLAPGDWHTADPLAEAEAFVQGLAAGWRFAEAASQPRAESLDVQRLEAAEQDGAAHPSKLSGTAREAEELFDPIEEPVPGDAEPEGKQAEAVHGAAVPNAEHFGNLAAAAAAHGISGAAAELFDKLGQAALDATGSFDFGSDEPVCGGAGHHSVLEESAGGASVGTASQAEVHQDRALVCARLERALVALVQIFESLELVRVPSWLLEPQREAVRAAVAALERAKGDHAAHPCKLSGALCEAAELFDPIDAPESGVTEPEGKQAEAVRGAAVLNAAHFSKQAAAAHGPSDDVAELLAAFEELLADGASVGPASQAVV